MPTIAAIATAPGAGGIGIVRISGPQSREILSRMFSPASAKFSGFRPWVLHRGRALDHEGAPLDDVLAVFMPGPRTFTGEDVAEIHCHGGPFIVQAILETALRLGARAAERGEFSRRAFVNGRMDLSQAEAVAELIAAPSREALRYSLNRLDGLLGRKVTALRRRLEELRVQMSLAVDFPDEEVECLAPEAFAAVVEDVAAAVRGLLTGQRRAQVMQQGAVVVLAGAVNAGKSSLLNALLGRNRALVTDIPGTTRDFLEESCQLDGLPVRLTDTAGLRETDESVEEMGVALSRQKVRQADAILLLVDGGRLGPAGAAADICPDEAVREVLEQAGDIPVLLVWNKVDLAEPAVWPPVWGHGRPCVRISASTGVTPTLIRCPYGEYDDHVISSTAENLAPNARQSLVLERALHELDALLADIAAGSPYDCCSVRLDAAAALLGEVTGLDSPEEVLNRVFSSFCIGK